MFGEKIFQEFIIFHIIYVLQNTPSASLSTFGAYCNLIGEVGKII